MSAATWILKTKEKYKIPQCAINAIIEDVTVLFQSYLCCIFDAVNKQLQSFNDCDAIVTSLSPLFDPDGVYGRPFKGLETEHLQLKFFKNFFAMIVGHKLCQNICLRIICSL